MERSNARKFNRNQVFLVSIAALLYIGLVTAKGSASAKDAAEANDIITKAPKDLMSYFWLAVVKFIKLMNEATSSLFSFNTIKKACSGGILDIAMCLFQFGAAAYFMIRYDVTMDEIRTTNAKELKVLEDEKKANKEKNNNYNNRNPENAEYLARVKRQNYSDSISTKIEAVRDKPKSQIWEKLEKFSYGTLRKSTIRMMKTLTTIQLYRSIAFMAVAFIVFFHQGILQRVAPNVAGTSFWFFSPLITIIGGLLNIIGSGPGIFFTGTLSFFGNTLCGYYTTLMSTNEKEKAENLYARNTNAIAQMIIRFVLAYLFFWINGYSLEAEEGKFNWFSIVLPFIDQIANTVLSDACVNWLYSNTSEAKTISFEKMKKKVHSGANYTIQWWISITICGLGAIIGIAFFMYLAYSVGIFSIPACLWNRDFSGLYALIRPEVLDTSLPINDTAVTAVAVVGSS